MHGCHLCCPWCHNPESRISQKDSKDLVALRTVDADELMREVEKDVLFFNESGGGVTFSGGEPLNQPLFLKAVLGKCRQRKIHCAVDTSGSGCANAVDVLSQADLILFDVKGLDESVLKQETGADLDEVNHTLEGLVKNKKRLWLRLPLIPGYGVMNAPIEQLRDWLEERQSWFERVSLLPYHRTAQNKYDRLGVLNLMSAGLALEAKPLERLAHQLRSVHGHVSIGG